MGQYTRKCQKKKKTSIDENFMRSAYEPAVMAALEEGKKIKKR
jgi:hypothetical protein